MQVNIENVTNKDFAKMGRILQKASNIGIDLNGYGELAKNKNSGYVYLWLEDYSFTLCCKPDSNHVYALHTCYVDGTETETTATYKKLESLEKWAEKLNKISEGKE